ncbi:hypothetical protein C3B79_1383 [Aeromonas hydrophila]|nr:hypothetical protein C3B79_1383 [Aeromonas hydrophila]
MMAVRELVLLNMLKITVAMRIFQALNKHCSESGFHESAVVIETVMNG